MNNFRTFLLTSTIALISASASAEVLSPGTDAFAEVGKAGPWTIYADASRKSCLIEGTDGRLHLAFTFHRLKRDQSRVACSQVS